MPKEKVITIFIDEPIRKIATIFMDRWNINVSLFHLSSCYFSHMYMDIQHITTQKSIAISKYC